MPSERDRWLAAEQFIKKHGLGAALAAAQQAEDASTAGDSEGESLWQDIQRKIQTLQRIAVQPGELN